MVLKPNIFDISLFERWLVNKGDIRGSTIQLYVKSVERFLTKNPNLENLDEYNTFLIDLTIKKRCTHYFSALRHFIDFKFTNNETKQRLMSGLLRPKKRLDYKQERKYLAPEKLIEILNYMDNEKHRIIALIQFIAGVRAGDVLRLERGNIQPDTYEGKEVLRIVFIMKGGKRNVVFIHDLVIQKLIWNYILNNVNYDKYYFIELMKRHKVRGEITETKLMNRNYFWYWSDLKQALQTANVDKELFATHDFRRCFARRVWTKYKDIYVLQKMLNHSDPKISIRYLEQSGLHNIDYHKEMQNVVE